MSHFPSTLVKTEVKASDLGGCKTSHDFAEFAKGRGGIVKEFKSLTAVQKGGKLLMFSNKQESFRIEYRKLLMRAFIAMGFLALLLFLAGIL